MKEVFCLKQQDYSLRNGNLTYPTPRTVSYGLETIGFKGCQLWHNLPKEIQCTDLPTFKKYVAEHCKNTCKCKLCESYIANLGYVQTTPINN